MNDFGLLAQVTSRIYLRCVRGALKAALSRWRVIGLHTILLFVFALVTSIFPRGGGMAMGLLMGLLLSVLLGIYLKTVELAVNGEERTFRETLEEGLPLFSPVLGVLFIFFIIQLLSSAIQERWILSALNLFIAVLFNPILEVIYLRSSMSLEMLQDSFEFVKENFIEWFLPILLLLTPLWLRSPELAPGLLTENPLTLLEKILSLVASLPILLQLWYLVIPVLYMLYFICIFRGLLYQELSTSSRRKRVYQERQRL